MADEFYREIVNYDFTKGECEPQAVRFTQLIWKKTKEVGFGIAKNEQTGKIYAVANYFPNGNGLGQFKDNVIQDKIHYMNVVLLFVLREKILIKCVL